MRDGANSGTEKRPGARLNLDSTRMCKDVMYRPIVILEPRLLLHAIFIVFGLSLCIMSESSSR